MGSLWVYIGTYTHGGGGGIYVGSLDADTGRLEVDETAVGGLENPSFLAVDGPRRRLYAVSEVGEFEGRPGGGVAAFALDPATGRPTRLNTRPSGGDGPCHLSVDPAGRFVLAANYGGGSVALLPLDADGSLSGAAGDVVPHLGAGVHPTRQEGPHAHSIIPDAAGRFALAADLGLDQILVYEVDAVRGRLLPLEASATPLRPGAGPRHLAFSPDGRCLYGINELDSTVTAWEYDGDRGRLREFQTVPTLPGGFTGPNFAADLRFHPSGRFLYGSNRGHDSLAVFAVEAGTGRLTPRGHVTAGGQTPRGFCLDPSGAYLLCAHQDSGTVAVFAVDPQTGDLRPTGHTARVPMPACVCVIRQ